jgi:hypothetical protein
MKLFLSETVAGAFFSLKILEVQDGGFKQFNTIRRCSINIALDL